MFVSIVKGVKKVVDIYANGTKKEVTKMLLLFTYLKKKYYFPTLIFPQSHSIFNVISEFLLLPFTVLFPKSTLAST